MKGQHFELAAYIQLDIAKYLVKVLSQQEPNGTRETKGVVFHPRAFPAREKRVSTRFNAFLD